MIFSGFSSEDDGGRRCSLPDLGLLHGAVTGNNTLGPHVTTRIVGVLFQEMTRNTMLVRAFVLCLLTTCSF